MKILVGSKNPVKIEAVKIAFSKYFSEVEVMGLEVDSNVPVQPVNEETFRGAQNRAENLRMINRERSLDAQFFAGIEGGIQQIYSRWFAFGCMCIMDEMGRTGFGTSCHFELPEEVSKRLLNGEELGDVMDHITGDENTKQKQGAVGYFTKGGIDRKELYVQGLNMALIPFLNKELYFG